MSYNLIPRPYSHSNVAHHGYRLSLKHFGYSHIPIPQLGAVYSVSVLSAVQYNYTLVSHLKRHGAMRHT
jgi:hypothetical protein